MAAISAKRLSLHSFFLFTLLGPTQIKNKKKLWVQDCEQKEKRKGRDSEWTSQALLVCEIARWSIQ